MRMDSKMKAQASLDCDRDPKYGRGGVPLAKGNADTVAACALGGPQALDKGEIARARFANDTSGRVLLVYKVRRTTAHLEGGSLSVGVALPLRIWAFWSLERRVF